ncbi:MULTISPECIES: helix-turn-helix domain-containing protein [unclassified Algibacter]|uniref:helix-turn-helix domain-containing protein n=1 Tax=unclassified Algibacter TaxID=2615009 RepID=UPI00131C70D0|nr:MULTISPECIES: helix-turn-helix domain-containing protein [unclassified Algibacter]
MIAFEQTQQDVAEVKKDIKELKAFFLQKAEIQKENDYPVSIDEIEKLTGYTKPTLYGYCQKNKIPYHKKNGRLFFFKSEIIGWIKQGKQKTIIQVGIDTDTLLSNKRKFSK